MTPTNPKEPMTEAEIGRIGKSCREALNGNLVVGSFAAEMVGESYPFSKSMCDVVFKCYTDIALGKRFVSWCDKRNPL